MAYELKMPQLGLTMETGTIGEWLKAEGDLVSVGDPLVQVETDKLTNDVESEVSGVLLKIVAAPGDELPVQAVLAYIGEPGEKIETSSAADTGEVSKESGDAQSEEKKEADAKSVERAPGERIRISPLARKTARKLGVDYTGLVGSGPGGRIVQKDILEAEKSPKPAKEENIAKAANDGAAPAELVFESAGLSMMDGDEVIKLTGMRKTVAARMYKSTSEIPSVTTTVKADVTALWKLRKQINEEMDVHYSINDYILKATAKTLRNHKKLLTAWDGNQIIQRAHVNLGMAVALETGLIVPVIRDADRLAVSDISAQAKELARKAREGRLSPEEYQDSTFSVSNMGMYGVESFTPVINQPDAAILGVCAIQDELALNAEGEVELRKVMRLSMTWDHRLMDGTDAAAFQADLRTLLENPMKILL